MRSGIQYTDKKLNAIEIKNNILKYWNSNKDEFSSFITKLSDPEQLDEYIIMTQTMLADAYKADKKKKSFETLSTTEVTSTQQEEPGKYDIASLCTATPPIPNFDRATNFFLALETQLFKVNNLIQEQRELIREELGKQYVKAHTQY